MDVSESASTYGQKTNSSDGVGYSFQHLSNYNPVCMSSFPENSNGYLSHQNTAVTYNIGSYSCQELLYANTNEKHTCGACLKYFDTICDLHSHIGFHGSDGSYHYDSRSRTAFPKYGSVGASMQTDNSTNTHQAVKHLNTGSSSCHSIYVSPHTESTKQKPRLQDVESKSKLEQKMEDDQEVNVSVRMDTEQVMHNVSLWIELNNVGQTQTCEDEFSGLKQIENNVALEKLPLVKVITTKNLLICITQKPACFFQRKTIVKSNKKHAHFQTKQKKMEENTENMNNVKGEVEVEDLMNINADDTTDKCKDEKEAEVSREETLDIMEHVCKQCKMAFVSEAYLQNHMLRHTEMFPCDQCFTTFSHLSNWMDHTCRQQEPRRQINIELYKCVACNKTFAESQGLKGHLCFEDGKNNFFRPFSKKGTIKLTEMMKNCPVSEKMVCNEENSVLEHFCDQCPDAFSNGYSLHVHKLVHFFPHKCSKCFVYFNVEDEKKKHQAQCKKWNLWQCHCCCKSFSTKFFLQKHQAAHRIVTCEKCGKEFTRFASLKRHTASCLKFECRIKTQECEECGKMFYSKTNLVKHKNTVHCEERTFICEVCGSTFKYSNALKKHAQKHLPDRPLYKCGSCEAAFSAKECLNRHRRCRHSENKFTKQCNVCGKMFAEKWNLKAHMRQHTGEKPYVCNICGQGFTHNVSRKTHMRNHHCVSL